MKENKQKKYRDMRFYTVIGVDGIVLGTNLSPEEAQKRVEENRENGLACNAYPERVS